jgi:hypothetical protein
LQINKFLCKSNKVVYKKKIAYKNTIFSIENL